MPTHRADYRFILKELRRAGSGADWALECYPETEQLPFISDSGCMYIRFKSTTSEEQANQIRELLNDHVADFSVVD